MKPKFDVITIGGATEDIFYTVDDFILIDNANDALHRKLMAFEYGSKIGVPEISVAFGGGATNAAVSFSRLGLRTAMIGAVGHDGRGLAIIRNLAKHKVNSLMVETISNAHSGVSFILENSGDDHIVFTHRGANDNLVLNKKQCKEIKKVPLVYLTSLSGNWKKNLEAIFNNAKSVAWNPGRQQISTGVKVLSPFLRKTNMLICNKDEATELVASHNNTIPSTSLNNIRFLLKELKKLVPGYVVITNGERGSMAFDGKKVYEQKIVKVKKVVNTTGVGDAFGSSFAAGMKLYQGDIAKSLLLGAKNSAAVVGRKGAQQGLLYF
jgi:sugar/nucleoside kinase (ribokinase family)